MAKHTPQSPAVAVSSGPAIQSEQPEPAPIAGQHPLPYVGAAIVYYAGHGADKEPRPKAALITNVWLPRKFEAEGKVFARQVDLVAFYPNGAQPWNAPMVPFSAEPKAGHWGWPVKPELANA